MDIIFLAEVTQQTPQWVTIITTLSGVIVAMAVGLGFKDRKDKKAKAEIEESIEILQDKFKKGDGVLEVFIREKKEDREEFIKLVDQVGEQRGEISQLKEQLAFFRQEMIKFKDISQQCEDEKHSLEIQLRSCHDENKLFVRDNELLKDELKEKEEQIQDARQQLEEKV